MFGERIKETTDSEGLDDFILLGALTGYETFVDGGRGDGELAAYCAYNATQWEVGIGTIDAGSHDTLLRTRVLQSSTGAKVVFLPGTKYVINTWPAQFAKWPVVKQTVDIDEELYVPEGYATMVPGIDIQGDIDIQGELVIL